MDAHRNASRPLSTTFALNLCCVLFALYATSAAAHIDQIDFDNLIQTPCTEENCDPLVVNNQYNNLGVTFVGGALYSADPLPAPLPPQIVSPLNALSDFYGPNLEIHFSGTSLPKAIGVYISAINEDAVFLTAYGNNGVVDSAITDGWRGTEETSTPYRDKQLVTLFSADGISQLNIETLFSRRGSLIIDNLQFGDKLNVPLPASAGLFAIALCGLLARSRRR